jgi:hypothetical protein
MYFVIDTKKVVEVFCFIDDFCQQVNQYLAGSSAPLGLLPRAAAGRKPSLSESEVLTIQVLYHLAGFKCFMYFYERLVLGELRSYFPQACSYPQFLALARQACFHAFLLAQYHCGFSTHSGYYYTDSKKLPVCDNYRIHSRRVFAALAARGKSSSGWFYGLKLHLVTNQH